MAILAMSPMGILPMVCCFFGFFFGTTTTTAKAKTRPYGRDTPAAAGYVLTKGQT
jgi:hypothetical protein